MEGLGLVLFRPRHWPSTVWAPRAWHQRPCGKWQETPIWGPRKCSEYNSGTPVLGNSVPGLPSSSAPCSQGAPFHMSLRARGLPPMRPWPRPHPIRADGVAPKGCWLLARWWVGLSPQASGAEVGPWGSSSPPRCSINMGGGGGGLKAANRKRQPQVRVGCSRRLIKREQHHGVKGQLSPNKVPEKSATWLQPGRLPRAPESRSGRQLGLVLEVRFHGVLLRQHGPLHHPPERVHPRLLLCGCLTGQ